MTSIPQFTHEDRDEIKRRAEADFQNLAIEHGARRRGKVFCCPFHKDRRPSASIHRGYFHCFVCHLSVDPIAFIERAQRTDFKSALSYLADKYGVALSNRPLSRAQKQQYAHAVQRADGLAQDVADWVVGVSGELRLQHRELMDAVFRLWELEDSHAGALEPEIERLGRLVQAFSNAPPAGLVNAYLRARAKHPRVAERYRELG
jgi:DNA primase